MPVAILLIGGILLARFAQVSGTAAFALFITATALCLARKFRLVAAAVGIFALGATLYEARYRITSNDLRSQLSAQPELVTVRGTIAETPSARDFESGTNSIVYTRSIIRVTEIARNKRWSPAAGTVASRTRGELPPAFIEGREVEITGVIEQPPRAAAPGLFDYRAYLRHQRVFFQLKSDSTNDWQLLSFRRAPLVERFRQWAKSQLQRGLPQDEQTELILAMTLGLRDALSGEGSEPFIRTGTMHLFAVSGLHVACIASFILYLLQWCGLSREHAGLATVPLIWFYTLATGWQSSAIRSALMFSVIIAGRLLKRPADLLNSTAAAAVLILLFQPEQLFHTGFQLSFVVVASLALLLPPIQSIRLNFLQPDPLLPHSLLPRWRLWTEPLWKSAGAMLAVSLASWLGSLPLTAYYFNVVTISSFPANLLAVPLSSVSLASTVFSIFLFPLGPIFNYLAWVFMWYTVQFTRLCAEMPFAYFYVPKPNVFFFAFYFAALLAVVLPALRVGTRKWIAFPAAAGLGVAWLCSILVARPFATVTVLPCAGTPTLVQVTGEPSVLIDPSSERDSTYTVNRFLHSRGLGAIDQLVLTHGDAQNVGGFANIWEQFRPKTVFTSPARARSPVYRRALQVLQQSPARWRTVAAGDQFSGWTVLHPPDNRGFPRADDNSIVLKRRIGPFTLLHLSDLGAAGQRTLLASGADLGADILISGMPERDEPLDDELLNSISPQVIVLGTSRYPYHAEGTPELRRRLEQRGTPVLYLTETDAITIQIGPHNLILCGMNGTRIDFHPAVPENRND